MGNFLQFLNEANAAGSKFEQKIANSLNLWFKKNKLNNKFKASRFQTIKEEDGNRDEDYSDVIVENLEDKSKFFIECKEKIKDNIITTQFDINRDFTLSPVKNKSREYDNSELLNNLAKDIEKCQQFINFCNFLKEKTSCCNLNISPSKYYFGDEDINEKDLNNLITKYNKMISAGMTEADNKPFNKRLLRDSTRNILACALLWRICDKSRTWDICHLENIPYFGDLIRKHYLIDKEIPAKYIQLGDHFFVLSKDDNPLDIDCSIFPKKVYGRFDLKFTPRFGSGSMYITPRSKITDELKSKCSFFDKTRWPIQKEYRKNIK